MTTYEHFMIAIVFGATVGYLIGGLIIVFWSIVDKVKEVKKARREKKKLAETTTDSE